MDAQTTHSRRRGARLVSYLAIPGIGTAALRLVIVGLLAIGVSGAVAGAMGAAFGRPFVSGDAPGVTYSKTRCADYFEYQPGAHTCEQAATLHHYGETVGYRVDAGILGVILLAAYLFYRRRNRSLAGPPAGLTATVATAAFGIAALGLLGQALILLARGQRVGIGDYLSAGIVSSIAAIIGGVTLFLARKRTARGAANDGVAAP